MQKIFLISTLFFLSGKSSAQALIMKDSVRGSRYCEIIIVTGNLPKLTATVYNTFECNACPPEQWNKIQTDKLKKKLDAKAVIKSGPRYLLMDKIGQNDTLPPSVSFDSLEMKQRAVVIVNLAMALKGRAKPYQEQAVHHSTEYVFNKGSQVYELISPTHTYIMQSYSLAVDTTLTEDSLSQLQNKLKLPEGWQFKTLKLEDDLVLQTTAIKEAYVIQDQLENTYQRID
jgi:hypothetical protein